MCLEDLLEFEESLAGLGSSNQLLLNNLELKADLNRFSSSNAAGGISKSALAPETLNAFTESTLLQLFSEYDYKADVVATCASCRSQLGTSEGEFEPLGDKLDNPEGKLDTPEVNLNSITGKCCQEFIRQQRLGPGSSLERDYWTLFFLNPYKTILTFPNYTKLVIYQMGVPFQIRTLFWRKMVLVNQKNLYEVPAETTMIFSNFQHSYNILISKQIKKDLGRTFPEIPFFQNPQTVGSLLTILSVYANYDLELGYCQGLLFLVGTLYQQLRSCEFTFHTMCKIMESEPQLRSIFVPSLMFDTLEAWRLQFSAIFAQVDRPLFDHLSSFCDMSVFLFQWWLSNNLIHAPNMLVNNRITECCLAEGWKVGNFKVSLGLLLQNRPILMSFGLGDEEVIYQHLLNGSKWGNVINNTTSFFGDLLLSWDDNLFVGLDDVHGGLMAGGGGKVEVREKYTTFFRLKNLSLGHLLLSEAASGTIHRLESRSLSSLFSSKDTTSVYSQSSNDCSDGCIKRSGRSNSFGDTGSFKSEVDDLVLENQALRFLLKKAYDRLEDDTLKREIGEMIEV